MDVTLDKDERYTQQFFMDIVEHEEQSLEDEVRSDFKNAFEYAIANVDPDGWGPGLEERLEQVKKRYMFVLKIVRSLDDVKFTLQGRFLGYAMAELFSIIHAILGHEDLANRAPREIHSYFKAIAEAFTELDQEMPGDIIARRIQHLKNDATPGLTGKQKQLLESIAALFV